MPLNAKWKYQFDPEETYQGNFHLEDGSVDDADYMVVEGNFNYTSNDDFTAVELHGMPGLNILQFRTC